MPKAAPTEIATLDRPAFEAKRMQILHKVALAFAADGYHQTSVNSLAERIGVSKPVLYYYAKNKDDLLFQCMMVTHVELMEVIENARRTKMSAVGRIASFFVSYTEVMCGDFGRCVALVDHKALSPDTGAKVVTMLRKIERAVADMISEGHTDGSVAPCDPLLAARALFGAFNGIPRWFNNEGSLRPREVAEAYLDIVLRGLQRS